MRAARASSRSIRSFLTVSSIRTAFSILTAARLASSVRSRRSFSLNGRTGESRSA